MKFPFLNNTTYEYIKCGVFFNCFCISFIREVYNCTSDLVVNFSVVKKKLSCTGRISVNICVNIYSIWQLLNIHDLSMFYTHFMYKFNRVLLEVILLVALFFLLLFQHVLLIHEDNENSIVLYVLYISWSSLFPKFISLSIVTAMA